MKVLFLTPRLPYPPYRGDRLHIFNLLREASRENDVYLLSFVDSEEQQKSVEGLRRYCRAIRTVLLSTIRSGAHCLAAIPEDTPFQVAYYRSRTMHRELERFVADVQPDVIHSHLIRVAQYRETVPDVPNILDLTDAVSLYLTRFVEKETRTPMKLALREELRRVRKYEPIVTQFEKVLVCSPVDRDFLQRNVPEAPLEVLPNGVDTDLFTPRPDVTPDAKRVIFTGNMTYFPNTDGAKFLVQEIWPLVKRRVPEARLYLVGQNPPPAIARLAAADVSVTGFVPSIQDEYAKSAVTVSPIRFGAGILNKVLEPLAMGIPVVCTDVGVSGLGLKHGKDILVADTAEGLADHIVRLLQDSTLRRALGESAMKRIRAEFSWHTIGKRLGAMYTEAVRRKS